MENYKQAIKDFIGIDGFCAFEHGYKPLFGAWGVSDSEVFLTRGGRQKIDDLSDKQAENLYNELLKYERYCKFEA